MNRILTVAIWACLITAPGPAPAQDSPSQPVRKTLTLDGAEREYFVRLPRDFDASKQHWLLAVIHGGGGNGRNYWMAVNARRLADELGLDVIVISPSFRNDDNLTSRFPLLGEDAFFEQVLAQARRDYRLRPKILLAGYSRGGQFAHRFTFAHPGIIEAAAPLASGTWTTPDGRFLVESLGEIPDPQSFLASKANAEKIPRERLWDLFDPRVAKAAGIRARPGSEKIPFLVMCGTLDPRLEIAQEFARSLESHGYAVQSEWPRTPHGCGDDPECQIEFAKYSRRVVEFFLRVVSER